jgi:hypothetical protein
LDPPNEKGSPSGGPFSFGTSMVAENLRGPTRAGNDASRSDVSSVPWGVESSFGEKIQRIFELCPFARKSKGFSSSALLQENPKDFRALPFCKRIQRIFEQSLARDY